MGASQGGDPVTALYLVRELSVPVEALRGGETLILPSSRRVIVESVDTFDDGTFVVRWWRRADRGEPGHRGGKHHGDHVGADADGRYLGSLLPMRRAETVRVARG